MIAMRVLNVIGPWLGVAGLGTFSGVNPPMSWPLLVRGSTAPGRPRRVPLVPGGLGADGSVLWTHAEEILAATLEAGRR
jgi:hypothetical protein